MQTIAIRLTPGQDLKDELDQLAHQRALDAACVLTCVGSLRRANLRFANRDYATTLDGKFEIISLTGTFSRHGSHYHIALSDGDGHCVGSHLLSGCHIYTTAEIIITGSISTYLPSIPACIKH